MNMMRKKKRWNWVFPHFQAQPGILELDRWFRFISGARDPSGPELLTFQVSKKGDMGQNH